jgi:hypothetical protein
VRLRLCLIFSARSVKAGYCFDHPVEEEFFVC